MSRCLRSQFRCLCFCVCHELKHKESPPRGKGGDGPRHRLQELAAATPMLLGRVSAPSTCPLGRVLWGDTTLCTGTPRTEGRFPDGSL